MRIRTAGRGDARAVAALTSLAYRVEDFFVIGDRTDEAQVLALMEKSTFLLLEDERGALAGSVYVDVRGDKVRLGIQAPPHVPVHREEVYYAIRSQKPDAKAA